MVAVEKSLAYVIDYWVDVHADPTNPRQHDNTNEHRDWKSCHGMAPTRESISNATDHRRAGSIHSGVDYNSNDDRLCHTSPAAWPLLRHVIVRPSDAFIHFVQFAYILH
jgi:hypothetical protein